MRGEELDGRYGDGGNLYCNVRGEGAAASWIFLRTMRGKKTVYTIGSVRALADLAGSTSPVKRAAASLTEARRVAAEYRLNIANNKPPQAVIKADYPSLDDIVEYWIKQKGTNRKAMNSFLNPFEKIFKEYGPVFSKDMGVAFRNSLQSSGKADNTVDNYMRQVKGMFALYIEDHSIDIVNPMAGVKFKMNEESINNRHPLPHDVIKKVYDSLGGDAKKMWLVLAVTGARLNEVYGLRGKDVTKDGFIIIEKNERRRLKNAASARKIPIFIKMDIRGRKDYWDDFKTISNLSQVFQRQINKHIPKEARGSRKFTTHSLRHTITDFMRYKGVSQNIEDFYLGHAADNISNTTYGSAQGRIDAMIEHLKPVIASYLEKLEIII